MFGRFRFHLSPILGFAALAILLSPALSWGYGAIVVNKDGVPAKFKSLANGTALTWNPETGPMETDELGKFFGDFNATCGGGGGGCSLSPWMREAKAQTVGVTNAEAIDIVNQSFATWAGVADARVSFTMGTSLGEDVGVCSADKFIDVFTNFSGVGDPRICGCVNPIPSGCTAPCQNPVIFDPNGDIISALAGPANRAGTLAVTGPVPDPNDSTNFLRFSAVFNGACLEPNPDPVCQGFTINKADLKAIMTHELGHGIGLDHTQTNPDSVIIPGTNSTAELASGANPEDVPTMYPILVLGASEQQGTLHRDDQVGLAHLYPSPTFAGSHCKLTGSLLNNTTVKGQRCAEVVVRKGNADERLQAISFVTGAEVAQNVNNPTEGGCATANNLDCGDFTIEGLDPNSTYFIEVNKINARFTGGSSLNPCTQAPPQTFAEQPGVSVVGTATCGPGGTANVNLNTTNP